MPGLDEGGIQAAVFKDKEIISSCGFTSKTTAVSFRKCLHLCVPNAAPVCMLHPYLGKQSPTHRCAAAAGEVTQVGFS